MHGTKVNCSRSLQSAPIVILSELLKAEHPFDIEWGPATSLEVRGVEGKLVSFTSVFSICRFIARVCTGYSLYGRTNLERTEIDHWIEVCNRRHSAAEFEDLIGRLDRSLSAVSYLVGDSLTLADVCVWSLLYGSKRLPSGGLPEHLNRWFVFLSGQGPFRTIEDMFPNEGTASTGTVKKEKTEDRGKFTELPGAEMGKVVVRFPPEASGYLHIGHAKAALLNAYYQVTFQGQLILRFDDTNPEKEKEDFEKVILEDVAMLDIKPDLFTYTSDHFDFLLEKCESLLKLGVAFVDDTDPETMKNEREQRVESKNRNNSIEKNWNMWEEMKKGTDYGKNCCVRAKIDMKSDNGCMRDPTLYRCKSMIHPRTRNKYNVYPTYDFACPIVDSLENVTHALRTTEYHDRDEQYFWILDALSLRKPFIYEYSRLNMTNTVLSKRKLTWFVEQGIVKGWDDPRMPTVRGVLRRGLTVEGLKQFIIAQGSSRSVVVMEWDKIWAFNKKVIDPVAPRFSAVEKQGCVNVFVEGASYAVLKVAKHPKNPELGTKDLHVGPQLFIDKADADLMKIGDSVTFINWGNLLITDIKRGSAGEVIKVFTKPNLENKDYKKTLKVTWVLDHQDQPLIPCKCVYFDHLISKPVLGKDDDFKNFLNENTRIEVPMLGDLLLASLKKGDIIQIQRKGFFICDEPYDTSSLRYTSREGSLVLFSIPDGSKDLTSLPAVVREIKEKDTKELSPAKEQEEAASKDQGNYKIDVDNLEAEIQKQGDLIRCLKAQKSDKRDIDAQVQILLKLKKDYKNMCGKEWKPTEEGSKNPKTPGKSKVSDKIEAAGKKNPAITGDSSSVVNSNNNQVLELCEQIKDQGDLVRKLKFDKAEKNVIDSNIKKLLKLKEDYKTCSGTAWTPESLTQEINKCQSRANNPHSKDIKSSESAHDLDQQIKSQGDIVRKLKSGKADKSLIDENVKKLLKLKEDYKACTGSDWKPNPGSEKSNPKPNSEKSNNPGPTKQKKSESSDLSSKNPSDQGDASASLKKITRLGLEVKKEENLAEWYSQVLTKAEMIEYYDISGCYILRPWSFSIWEAIQKFFDSGIKALGVTNCYFPMFVSSNALEKEKTHIEDFAPEVAWVTKSGSSDLDKAIAIRPTSETVMYPSYAKWIRSHRDLPLKLNQWCNVVRWEFRNPQPFIRTREFLWQEGHTAFATKEEAENEVFTILELYSQVYEYLLAIPVIKGKKTEKEKFAGADFTTTTEAYVPANGRGIQGATSHHLGQNFSKMFEIVFEDPETGDKQFVYQNSWGLSTRTIGAMVMIHGDNTGLVLPPRVAAYQVVIVPCGITANLKESEKDLLLVKCSEFQTLLQEGKVSVKLDARDNYSPGWKFNYWELKGVPLRIELGPKDIKKNQFVAVRRDTGEKITLNADSAPNSVLELLDRIHESMFAKAKKSRDDHLCVCYQWSDFCDKLEKRFVIQAPFCGEIPCEENIKKDSARNADENLEPGAPSMGAKSLCIPFEQPAEIKPTTKCIHPNCTGKPKYFTLFGRSY